MSFERYTALFTKEYNAARRNKDTSPTASMAITMVLVSFVEHLLMMMLDRRFVDLKCGECQKCKNGERCDKNDSIYDIKGTLNSFSKCADVALRIGLITMPMRKNLAHIADVRNRFAHNPGLIDFSDSDVERSVKQITFPKIKIPKRLAGVPIPTRDDPVHGEIVDFAHGKDVRSKFIDATERLWAWMHSRAESIEHLIPMESSW
jgi:hypothetical protein